MHGQIGTLLLFHATWYRILALLGITAARKWLVRRSADLVYWWNYRSPWSMMRKEDEPEYFDIEQLDADLVAKIRSAEGKGAVSHVIGKLPRKGENVEVLGLSYRVEFADYVKGKYTIKLICRDV